MYEGKLTIAVSTRNIASCNICYARNYDAMCADSFTERVERLYELDFEGRIVTLCGKCLDKLREQIMQYIGTGEKYGELIMSSILCTGTEFTAKDKLGQLCCYRVIGIDISCGGLFCLLNMDTYSMTYVEPAWFRERKIKVVQPEKP